jgi:peptidyl-prolyl cis-trans isomerase C
MGENVTDERNEGAPDVSDESNTTRPDLTPEREDAADGWDARDEGARRDGDRDGAADPAALRTADASGAAATDEPADDGRRRPPLPIIIGAVLLLVAIGAGLAFLIPSGPIREADQLIPTNDPASATAVAEAPAGEVPTALPLPVAVEGDASEVIAEVDELLDQLIQRELVIQQGLKEGVVVDDEQVTAQLDEIKASQGGGDAAQFEAFLTQAKIGSEENLRRLLGHDQIIEAMILRHTTGEQAHARHILLSTENISDTAALRSEAEALLEQLEGGADFAALAAENSDDPGSAANGGDLGWALRGSYVPEFDEAVFTMQPGEFRLVETQFGFHIIEVIEPAEVRGLESSAQLQTQPGQLAFQETFIPWVDKLQSDAEAGERIKILVPVEQLVALPEGAAAAPTAAP